LKITNEEKKVLLIKELDVAEVLIDVETGEALDLNSLLKINFDNGDCVKIQVTRVIKSEE